MTDSTEQPPGPHIHHVAQLSVHRPDAGRFARAMEILAGAQTALILEGIAAALMTFDVAAVPDDEDDDEHGGAE